MPATVTTSILNGGYTQQTLADAIVAAYQPVLGTPLNRVTSGTDLRAIWLLPKKESGDKDLYFVIDVSTTHIVNARTATAYTAPNTLTQLVSQSSATFSATSSSVNFSLFSISGECVLLMMTQGVSTRGYFGVIQPATLSSWWARANFSPWLLFSGSSFGTCATNGTAPNVYGLAFNAAIAYTNFTARSLHTAQFENPAIGRRDVVPVITYSSQYGYAGSSSPDLAYGATNGLALFDILVVQAGVEEYVLVEASTTTGFAIRTF